MLASVIVRTMGRPSLAAALASVVAQGRDDVGVVVVDARGTLVPVEWPQLPLQWVSAGRGLPRSDAAQAGLDAVTSRYALFLDDDDLLLPGHLDKLLRALVDAPQAVLAYTGVEVIGAGAHSQRSGSFDQAYEAWELLLGNRMPIHAALFDVARARAAGARFDPALDLYEDWDFWLQLRLAGDFVHVPGISAQYLVGDTSSDAHRLAPGDEAFWRVWRKWWTRAPAAWWTQALVAGANAGDTQRHLQATRDDLQQRLEQIHALHRQLRDAGDAASRLHQLLGEQVQHTRLAQIETSETKHQLAQAQGSLSWTQEALRHTQQQLADQAQQLAQTAQALAAAQLEQQRSAEQVQAMLQSTSWRLTRPVRQLATLARGARGQASRFRREVLARQALVREPSFHAYQQWIAGSEAAERARRVAARTGRSTAAEALSFSIVMPAYEPDLHMLDEAIASVRAQEHARWQLCIADDASAQPGVRERLAHWAATDQRIEFVQRAVNGHIAACTNSALALARGDWVLFLDQDDLLAPHALLELADAISSRPDLVLVYSDEDKLDAGGHRFEPHFKPAYSIELLRGQNFINHLAAYRRDAIESAGGLAEGFDGAQDHELALRVAERLRPGQVHHVPQVLYHWRASAGSTALRASHKDYAAQAMLRAVSAHLARSEPGAQAEPLPGLPWLRVRYPLPPATALPLARLSLGDGLEPRQPGWRQELESLLARPGIGVVAGTVFIDGRLAAGAWVPDVGETSAVLCAGVRHGDAGAFGAAQLVRGCDAVTSDVMLVREDLWPLWVELADLDRRTRELAFGRAVREAGWRLLWTPHAAFDARSA